METIQESEPSSRLVPEGAASNTEKPKAKSSLLHTVSDWIRTNLNQRGSESSLLEAVEEAIEEHEETNHVSLSNEERTMLKNILSFGDITVSDIMIPRPDIIAVNKNTTLEELQKMIAEHQHTRMPVYKDNLDNVEGFLHIKDLIKLIGCDTPFIVKGMVRPVLFVAPSMRIIDLLVRMRISGDHMALVVDEYGGTDGLITLEDVFEEIVGEIQDEHDEVDTNQAIIPVKENVYEADARVRVDQLEETLGIELSKEDREEDFDTLGGLIFFTLGRVPARGELIEYNSSFSFEVIDVDPRRIKKVRIARLNASPANEIANRA